MNHIPISGFNITLYLLSIEELRCWMNNIQVAENLMGYKIDSEPVKDHLKNVFEIKIQNIMKNPGSEMWNSYFAIIYSKTIVGLIGSKGEPIKGCIEIGYGISDKYRNRGFMTEAVSIFCDWFFNNTEVKIIRAETDRSNISSQKVLIKNGFKKIENGEFHEWEKQKIGE